MKFVGEKERAMEPINGCTYLMMGHTHPHPSFPVSPASRIVLTTELLRLILIYSQDVEKIFPGLDFKTWPEGSRRVLQNARTGHSAVLHRAQLCCQPVAARLPTDTTTARLSKLMNITSQPRKLQLCSSLHLQVVCL